LGRSSIRNAMSRCLRILMKWSRSFFSSAFVEDFLTMQPVRAISRFGFFRLRVISFSIEPMTLSSAFCFTEQELKIIRSALA